MDTNQQVSLTHSHTLFLYYTTVAICKIAGPPPKKRSRDSPIRRLLHFRFRKQSYLHPLQKQKSIHHKLQVLDN